MKELLKIQETRYSPGSRNLRFKFMLCMLGMYPILSSAQVTMIFDQETKGITFDTNAKWKVGELLKVTIENYQCNSLKYVIAYTSSENVNAKGLAVFNTASSITKNIAEYSPTKYHYLYIPIESKDYSHITITEYDGTSKTDEVVYSYRVRGGLKFDVSTGFFTTGLRDDSYILVNYTNDKKTIVADSVGDFRVGAGVLAHLHSRWNCPVNIGVAGGFEINNDASIGYLAGGSVFFGYNQKFVVSGGIVLGKEQVLSKAHYVGQEVDNIISVVPMVNVWKESWFVSLTYNF